MVEPSQRLTLRRDRKWQHLHLHSLISVSLEWPCVVSSPGILVVSVMSYYKAEGLKMLSINHRHAAGFSIDHRSHMKALDSPQKAPQMEHSIALAVITRTWLQTGTTSNVCVYLSVSVQCEKSMQHMCFYAIMLE